MPIDLRDKPIIITGASSGIGRAAAIACARAGMPVLLNARRHERLDELAREIQADGGRAKPHAADVAEEGVNESLVENCVSTFGSVYAVLANAGFGFEAPTHALDEARLRRIFEVNFFATMRLIHAAVPPMLDARAGHVLVTSSCIGKLPVPYFGAYCATKASQWHMTAALRWELASRGIHASSVHPVGTKTEFFDRAREMSKPPPHGGATLADHSPQWLMQRSETVAKAIVNCLRRPKDEVWPAAARFVQFGMAFANAFPRLPGFFFRRGMVRHYEDRYGSAE